MLNYNTFTAYREKLFRKMSDRFYSIVLQKDEVVPPYEVINTLQGVRRDIPIKIEVLDYPYRYTHENPFPVNEKDKDEIDYQFKITFDKIGDFLCE